MKRTLLVIVVLLLAVPMFAARPKGAEIHLTPQQVEANYTRAIEHRTANILKALRLSDTNQAVRVHDILIAQWRALRAWHDAHDAKLKAALRARDSGAVAAIRASLKALHNRFLARLAANLTPAQIETVKDKMTYGTVEATYRAYCEIVPGLTASDKAEILKLLKQARDEAMDCGSAREKAAVFKRYKGRINNYLDAHGHNVGKAYKDWGERQKMKSATHSASGK